MLALSFGQISYNNDFKKLAEQFQKVNLDAMAAEVHVKISTQNTVSTFQSKNHKVPFTHVFLFLPILLTFPERKTFWSRALDVTATLFMGSTSNFHTWKPCHDWGRVSTSELPPKKNLESRNEWQKHTFLQHLSYGDSFEIIGWFSFLMVIHHSSPWPVQSHVKFQYAMRTPWKLPLVEPRLQQWGKGTKHHLWRQSHFAKVERGNLSSIKKPPSHAKDASTLETSKTPTS